MESAPKIEQEENIAEATARSGIEQHSQNESRAQLTVREMFDENWEARGTIKNVINHGIEHQSDR